MVAEPEKKSSMRESLFNPICKYRVRYFNGLGLVNIDAPNINYIIYSKIEGLIPTEVKSLFSVVN